jgi:hypothetical protein
LGLSSSERLSDLAFVEVKIVVTAWQWWW